jgi:competence protein ComEA
LSLSRIALSVVAIVAAIASVYALFRAIDERTAPPIVIEDAAATLPIVVDVRGAVRSPGVYELAPGARMQDAVSAAGGLGPTADLSVINLARRLRDGEVVVIGEVPTISGSPEAGQAATGAFDAGETTGKLNINTATTSELVALPGVGEVTAQRIVDYRNANGPFHSVDELDHVQGISARTIEGLRDLVTVAP